MTDFRSSNSRRGDRFAPRDFGNRFSRFESEAPETPAPSENQFETGESTFDADERIDQRPAFSKNRAGRTAGAPGGFIGFWKSFFWVDGRATRARFWAVYVVGSLLFTALFIALLLAEASGGQGPDSGASEAGPGGLFLEGTAGMIVIGVSMLYAWVNVITTVRRYHDRNKPGVWALLLFVPLGYLAVLLECGFAEGTPGPNQYGPDPQAD
ncbi:MAG: DUF805 domain-containing protein [bacterium]|nr:DUF805 domain-containing protein [bacterium]